MVHMNRFLLGSLFALSIGALGCTPQVEPQATGEGSGVTTSDEGYTVTKKPLNREIVPVYPDPADPKTVEAPTQSSYDTPYRPDTKGGEPAPPKASKFKPMEAKPADQARKPDPVKPGR